jgi:hypothetical protein
MSRNEAQMRFDLIDPALARRGLAAQLSVHPLN